MLSIRCSLPSFNAPSEMLCLIVFILSGQFKQLGVYTNIFKINYTKCLLSATCIPAVFSLKGK